MRQPLILAVVTALALIAGLGGASAGHYEPGDYLLSSPAQDYSASGYRSRGGIGRPGTPSVYGYNSKAPGLSTGTPYSDSCGSGRRRDGRQYDPVGPSAR